MAMTGDQWRAALAQTGVSQQQFARSIGRDPSTVRRWIAGASAPPPETEILVDLLQNDRISVDDLRNRKP
jgi:DNA-binding transcriptional regulator YiaG